MMALWKMVEPVEGTPIAYVGCYILSWPHPTNAHGVENPEFALVEPTIEELRAELERRETLEREE